jgi:uncharacterized protein (DUF362 family)/Pyruvate/2-oxoacid:ferredoxin oxidoreductase delta subunit
MPIVSVVNCETYEIEAVHQAVAAVLEPLGGLGRFVRPGMDVLLKPNLLTAADPERAVTTHPAVVQAVTELVQQAGGTVHIGDSPAGSLKNAAVAWRKSGLTEVVSRTGAQLIPFEEVTWERFNGRDYFIARPVLGADLVINMPKLKTHMLTLYTGAVKNLFGTIPGTRKREFHFQAPGVQDFSSILVDVLELVRPGLTIMDGVLGLEGNGPGLSGTLHGYGCLAASTDPVALDTVMTRAMGYRRGEVLHVAEAGSRGLGVSRPDVIPIRGDCGALDFAEICLPRPHWYFRAPAWAAAPLRRLTRLRPQMTDTACIGCGKCVEACPQDVITQGKPPTFDLDRCIGCLCCAEVCPQGAIEPHRNLLAKLIGMGY